MAMFVIQLNATAAPPRQGQKAREDDSADERQREAVGKKFGSCHQRVSYMDTPGAARGVLCVKSGRS